MGGRGSSSPQGGDARNRYTNKKEDPMNVPYDEWGKRIESEPIYEDNGFGDGQRAQIGYYEDIEAYDYIDDIRPITKKEAVAELDIWKNDKEARAEYGSYGDEDVSIIVAYKDGKVVSDDELENGKLFSKTGIVGISVSTADYEVTWGGEVGKDGNIRLWETSETEDGKTYTNSYRGYKIDSKYLVRRRVTWNNKRSNGGYYTKYERVRQSTKKKVNW